MFAYTKNNSASMRDENGFRTTYTMDEETDEMREASYAVMATAAKSSASYSIIDSGSSNYSFTDSLTKGAKSSAIDKAGEIISGIAIKGKTVWEDLGTLTLGRYVTKFSKGATLGKKALGIVGSVGFTVWDCYSDIAQGQYVVALVDATGALVGIGIGIGIGIGALTGAIVTASTPLWLAGTIGAAGIGFGVLASTGIDKVTSGIKKEYYGR